jgi:hypothetical protein
MSFQAHTGKFVLALQGGSSELDLPIANAINYNYALETGSSTAKGLVDAYAVQFTPSPSYPNSVYTQSPDVEVTSNSVNVSLHMADLSGENAGFVWIGYMQIPVKADYHFALSVGNNYSGRTTALVLSDNIGVTLTDMNGTTRQFSTEAANNSSSGEAFAAFSLCPGIWKIEVSGATTYANTHQTSGDCNCSFEYQCTDCSGPIYENTTPNGCTSATPIAGSTTMMNPVFNMPASTPMVISAWVRENPVPTSTGVDTTNTYSHTAITVYTGAKDTTFYPQGPIIDGWQRIEGYFTSAASGTAAITLFNSSGSPAYLDDIRIHPFNAEMKSYIYDPVSLRLSAELDDNNYATFYEYDEEGTLVRTKAETQRGIQTIKETRSAKQKNITTIQ